MCCTKTVAHPVDRRVFLSGPHTALDHCRSFKWEKTDFNPSRHRAWTHPVERARPPRLSPFNPSHSRRYNVNAMQYTVCCSSIWCHLYIYIHTHHASQLIDMPCQYATKGFLLLHVLHKVCPAYTVCSDHRD
jgi:hypothetical protein